MRRPKNKLLLSMVLVVFALVFFGVEFDPDEAELTRTRKLRRTFVEDRYGDLISALYSDQDELTIESPVTYQDGRTGVIATNIKISTLAQ